MNLSLEITTDGFIVKYFGKTYFEFNQMCLPELVYNHWQGTYYRIERFKNIIANILDDKTAIHVFWLMIDTYTKFGE